jgi:hypothetical protein
MELSIVISTRALDGGIITQYTIDLEPDGCSEANYETTAMAILAYEERDRNKAKGKKKIETLLNDRSCTLVVSLAS